MISRLRLTVGENVNKSCWCMHRAGGEAKQGLLGAADDIF